MNQKGFANIILVVVIVVLVGAVGYFVFVKKSAPIAQQPNPTQTQTTIQAETSVSPNSIPSATEQSEKDTETSQNNIAPKKTPMAVPLSDLLSLNPYANAKHKYKIFAPKGWTIDSSKSNYFVDAFLFDSELDHEGKLDFKTNINTGAVPLDVAGVSSLDNCVTADKLAKLFPNYVSTGDVREVVNGVNVRIIGGTYDYGEYHLRNMQLLAVENGFYYDMTATALASQWDKHRAEIEASLRSLIIE